MTIAWVLSLLAYVYLVKECGKFHLFMFSIPLFFFLLSNWKADDNINWRLSIAIRYPFICFIIVLLSYFGESYLLSSALEDFPDSLEGRQQLLSFLFILTLFTGDRLSITKQTGQVIYFAVIGCTCLLIWRIYNEGIVFSIVIGICSIIWLFFSKKKNNFFEKLQHEALTNPTSKASDQFWFSCFNNTELSEKLRWKAFDRIKEEDKIVDFFESYPSVRDHFSKLKSSKIEYPHLLGKVKKWNNRIRLFSYLSETQKLKCIDECDDKLFLENSLLMNEVEIKLTKNDNSTKSFFERYCIKIDLIWNQSNSPSLLK
ncbi:MAG: hypothetical protein JPMHGGIA_01557 [Saprospiraceae bacterium]|nr:hypothetical protein [Saprospiraceae bacterium]